MQRYQRRDRVESVMDTCHWQPMTSTVGDSARFGGSPMDTRARGTPLVEAAE